MVKGQCDGTDWADHAHEQKKQARRAGRYRIVSVRQNRFTDDLDTGDAGLETQRSQSLRFQITQHGRGVASKEAAHVALVQAQDALAKTLMVPTPIECPGQDNFS